MFFPLNIHFSVYHLLKRIFLSQPFIMLPLENLFQETLFQQCLMVILNMSNMYHLKFSNFSINKKKKCQVQSNNNPYIQYIIIIDFKIFGNFVLKINLFDIITPDFFMIVLKISICIHSFAFFRNLIFMNFSICIILSALFPHDWHRHSSLASNTINTRQFYQPETSLVLVWYSCWSTLFCLLSQLL